MNAMTKETEKKKPSQWYVLTACALAGAVAGYIGSDLITGGANGEPLLALSWSQGAALFVAAILLVCIVMIAIGFTFPKAGIAMKMFQDIEQWEDERTMMWLSVLGCTAYGAVIVILALADLLDLIGSVPALAAIGVLVLVFCYSGWRLLNEYDELWQGVNAETCTYGMYLTMLIGGVWSIAAHLGFIPALAPLDWITLLTVTSFTGAIVATQKRGMLDDR